MARINRRKFLRLGVSGLAAGALGPALPWPLLRRGLHAASLGTTPKKMLVIFMRGGNDGVNTVIPYGDSAYNPTNRPTIFIPEAQAIDLGNGFAGMHPALAALDDVFATGSLACIHRVGYENQSRSHFDSQHFWETGVPGDNGLEEGMLYRQIVETLDLDTNLLPSASISNNLMLMFKGQTSLPHIQEAGAFNVAGGGTPAGDKLLGEPPSPQNPGSGMLGWYGQPANSSAHDELVKGTGLTLGSIITLLEESGIDPATYVPENGATYPSADAPQGFPGGSFEFFRQLRDAAMLLKLTDCRIAGVELGGFDTHSQQGGVNGQQANLLSWAGHGIRSISLDLQAQWDDTLVVTMSEFGRTSEENGSVGTDHGEASVMFAAGGSVAGGVYNCDATTWADGDIFSTPNGRYVARLTDYRAVFRDIFQVFFGITDPAILDAIIPGLSSHAGDPTFAELGFLV